MSKTPKREFDHCADDYATFRPGYPAELLEHIVDICPPVAGTHVADVGAGTGIFTRHLVECEYSVIAVEPSEELLARVVTAPETGTGQLHRVCASAERTGLATESVRLITCAQSFHWFNPPIALKEFARILVRGGHLVLTWNNRDREKSAFVAAFEMLVRKFNSAYDVEYRQQDWDGKIRQSGCFRDVFDRTVTWNWDRTFEEFVGFTRSVSYIRNVLARERVPIFESELRDMLRSHFGEGRCRIPMRTNCWWTAKK